MFRSVLAVSAIVLTFTVPPARSLGSTIPRSCADIFSSASATERKKLEQAAAVEAAALLSRFTSRLAVARPEPVIPTIKKSVDLPSVVQLDVLFSEAAFKKGSSSIASLDTPGAPNQNAIAQIVATPDSVLLLKPNFKHAVYSGFGTAPLRVVLGADGKLGGVAAMFPGTNHPLRNLDPSKYHYDISLNLETSVARAVLTINEQRDGNYRNVAIGQADTFFVSVKSGKAYPSLSAESNYRFANVVALSDTVYVTEVAKGSPTGRAGDMVIFEYNPGDYVFRRLMLMKTDHPLAAQFANILRRKANRASAHGAIGLNHLLNIETESHRIQVRLPDPEGDYPGDIAIYPISNIPLKAGEEASNVGRTRAAIKVIATQTSSPSEKFSMTMFTGSRPSEHDLNPTTVTYIASRDEEENVVKSWRVKADRLSPIFYRVNDGFIVQRDGRDGHGLIFLKDSGVAIDITEKDQSWGAITVVDGKLIAVGPGGSFLKIWEQSEWR